MGGHVTDLGDRSRVGAGEAVRFVEGPTRGWGVGVERLAGAFHSLRQEVVQRGQDVSGRRVVALRELGLLVVVASGTGNSQRQESTRESIDAIVERFALCLCRAIRVAAIGLVSRSQSKEACSDRVTFLADHVTGYLQFDKLVIR